MLNSSAIAGACAGLVSAVVTCPLDVVKTRLQAQEGRRRPVAPDALSALSPAGEPTRYLGPLATLRKIWRDDGPRGLFRGLGPTVLGYTPSWGAFFFFYDLCKTAMAQNDLLAGKDMPIHIVSAMTAGAASTVCTSPLWVVKTRFMLQSVKDPGVKPYRNTADAFVQIYRSEGLKGFYRGLLPSLFGVSHVAVQFPLYESFKSLARNGEDGELEASTILLCSSTAKMIASVTTYPHEVVRTRLQMQPKSTGDGNRYSGVLQACRTIAREEGFRGYYNGMGVNLMRTIPSSALTILTYELIMQHLTHQQQGQEEE